MNATSRCSDRVGTPSDTSSTVRRALARHAGAYERLHGLHPPQRRVLDRILACRTRALGAHLRVCTACGWRAPAYNSCRDRHCPQCQGRASADWAAARRARMLDVPHFQVVFTLPAALRPLARLNPDRVYGHLFASASGVLRELAADRLGGRLGMTAVLHTWTRDLTYHPHVHVLVTAGALAEDQDRWVRTRPNFLFPSAVLGALFRGRMLEALLSDLQAGALRVPGDDAVAMAKVFAQLAARHRKRWVVHVEPPNGRPRDHVLRYLARYVKRVAISDQRIVAVTGTDVRFRGTRGIVQVDGVEFVRRFLLHILPSGFRKVRHYGLYAPGAVHTHLARAAELVAAIHPPPVADTDREVEDREERERCPGCGERHVVRIHPGATVAQLLAAFRPRGPP